MEKYNNMRVFMLYMFNLYTHLSFISELTSRVPQGGYGEYISWVKALYDSKNECAKTDTVIFSISEVCEGTVSLLLLLQKKKEYYFL